MTRRIVAPLALLLVATTFAACGEKTAEVRPERADVASPGAAKMVVAPVPTAAPAPPVDALERRAAVAMDTAAAAGEQAPRTAIAADSGLPGTMLIRAGQATLRVDSLDAGIARVRAMARRVGALVADVSVQTGRDEVRTASLELRIPVERFDDAVSGLSPIGAVESVNVTAQDVGEEFVDVGARVANARRLEQQLLDVLAHRTGRLSDVLMVERELARVREEIERYEGRLRYLRARVAVSRLTVTVHEPLPLVADRPGAQPLRDAAVQAWRNFVHVLAAMIASLGVLVPVGAVLLLGALALRRLGVVAPRRSAGVGEA